MREHTRICGCCLRSGGERGPCGPGKDYVCCLNVRMILVATSHALEFRLALAVSFTLWPQLRHSRLLYAAGT